MKYSICLLQDGGLRHYLGATISANVTTPATPANVDSSVTHRAVSELLCRIAGWEYFKHFLQPGAVGVEIGSDYGDGAARWLETNPSTLHMVDPWLASDEDGWYSADQTVMDERYESVKSRFADDARVVIHRGKSADVLSSFSDNSVDWVFIDGDHSVNGAYSDMLTSLRIVRPGGIIAGDDMHGCMLWEAQVRAAYERFMSEYGDKVEVIWDQYAPFILRKKVA